MSSKVVKLLIMSLVFLIASLLFGCKPDIPDRCRIAMASPSALYLMYPHGRIDRDQLSFRWLDMKCMFYDDFQIRFTDNSTGEEILIDSTGDTNIFPGSDIPGLKADVIYDWTVRPVLQGITGVWANEASFKIIPSCNVSDLEIITPDSPVNHSIQTQTDLRLKIKSHLLHCTPDNYHYQIARDPGFLKLVEDWQGILHLGSGFAGTGIIHLQPCQEYFWRVAGNVSGQDGPFTDPIHFYIQTEDCPPMSCGEDFMTFPNPISPSEQAVIPLNPNFRWDYESVCYIDNFQLEIQELDAPANPIIEQTSGPDLSWSLVTSLRPKTYYTWKVAAMTNAATGPYSQEVIFVTGPSCTNHEDADMPTEVIYPNHGDIIRSNSFRILLDDSRRDCQAFDYKLHLYKGGSQYELSEYSTKWNFYPYFDLYLLEDCTSYNFHIETLTGEDPPPRTETRIFHVDYSQECDKFGELLYLEFLRDTPCRLGPGSDYDLVMYLLEGENASVVGQGSGGGFWIIEPSDRDGAQCWLPQANATLQGDPSNLPVIQPPYFPSSPEDPSPEGGLVCSGYLSPPDCAAAGGSYNMVQNPPCTCP